MIKVDVFPAASTWGKRTKEAIDTCKELDIQTALLAIPVWRTSSKYQP